MVLLTEDRLVVLSGEDGLISLLRLVVIEEFQKENPRSLLGVVHGPGDAIVPAEDVGDAVNFLLKGHEKVVWEIRAIDWKRAGYAILDEMKANMFAISSLISSGGMVFT